MGLGNNTYENTDGRTYLNIQKGKIMRKLADGNVEAFDHLTGTLTDIFVKELGKFGPELHLTLRDEGQDYCIQMFLHSGYAKAFMKIVKNIALAQPFTIIPTWKQKEFGNPDTGMIIKQGGAALKWYYTRDNPNGLPQAVQCKVRDQKSGSLVDSWDYSEQERFLSHMLIYEIKPILPPPSVVENRENIAAVQGGATGGADDLPF